MNSNDNQNERKQMSREERFALIFGEDANLQNGGDDVSLESANAKADTSNTPQYQTVVIDGDEYDFLIEETKAIETAIENQFVGMTTICYNTGKIFLAEGTTEQEAFSNSVEAILPAGMWQHANIYDVTKRRNLEVVTIAKARQYGYKQKVR